MQVSDGIKQRECLLPAGRYLQKLRGRGGIELGINGKYWPSIVTPLKMSEKNSEYQGIVESGVLEIHHSVQDFFRNAVK